MKPVRRFWQPDQGWSSPEDLSPAIPAQVNGVWAGDGNEAQAATVPASEVTAASPPAGEGAAALDRRAHLADLRRALVLTEILGPPLALRGGGHR